MNWLFTYCLSAITEIIVHYVISDLGSSSTMNKKRWYLPILSSFLPLITIKYFMLLFRDKVIVIISYILLYSVDYSRIFT